MKKKLLVAGVAILATLILMFAEYRFIMRQIKPYRGEGGTVYLEVFGQVDEYYADTVFELGD